MSYKFKGFDWTELAECWGITAEPQPFMVNVVGESEPHELGKVSEKIEVTKFINGIKMVFTIDDEEEVLAEKVKQHIFSNIDFSGDGFKDKQMRKDLESFLNELIKEEEEHGYNAPVYKGILQVESDETFAKWICYNLESLWT